MADELTYTIVGNDLQAVQVQLDPGETVRAEPGVMLYMGNGVDMATKTEGGMLGGLKRMVTGENFFVTSFTNQDTTAREIAFAAPYPGHIAAIDLAQVNGTFYCQRDSFLAAAGGVDVSVAFTKKLGAGLFGGEGFILQKLTGDGLAFVHIGGTLIKKQLQPGETLRVDTGCLAGFTEGVQYDIQLVKGVTNMLFGNEGLFHATLTGPDSGVGEVYLQTLPFARIADRINSAAAGSASSGGEVERIGGLVGDILGGR